MEDKKRKRDIFGFLCDPPRPCPMCKEATSIFERTEDERGKAVFICSKCMDEVIEEMKRQIDEHFGDPDY